MFTAENIRTLGHEMNTAENDEFGLLLLSGPGRQFEGISPKVGKADDFVSLIVVTKDHQTGPKPGANLADSLVGFRVGQLIEAFR